MKLNQTSLCCNYHKHLILWCYAADIKRLCANHSYTKQCCCHSGYHTAMFEKWFPKTVILLFCGISTKLFCVATIIVAQWVAPASPSGTGFKLSVICHTTWVTLSAWLALFASCTFPYTSQHMSKPLMCVVIQVPSTRITGGCSTQTA